MVIIRHAFSQEFSCFKMLMFVRFIEIVVMSLALIAGGITTIVYAHLGILDVLLGCCIVTFGITGHRHSIIQDIQSYLKDSDEELVKCSHEHVMYLPQRVLAVYVLGALFLWIPTYLILFMMIFAGLAIGYGFFWSRMYNPDPIEDYYPVSG